jgi:hypothetical protein
MNKDRLYSENRTRGRASGIIKEVIRHLRSPEKQKDNREK